MPTRLDLFRSSAFLRRSDTQPKEKFVHQILLSMSHQRRGANSRRLTEPTLHKRNSPRRQFIVQPILDPASHDLADSTHYDKDKAKPTPPIIAMLPLEEEQDTNTNQEQANGVECYYFVAGDKSDQLLHDGPPLIGPFSHVPALSFPTEHIETEGTAIKEDE